MIVLWWLVTAALVLISLITVVNVLTFPRLRHEPLQRTPRVSLLIPARNEAAVIGSTVQRLLAQHYPDFEVIVLDDNSDDDTAQLALRAAAGDARLRVISGAPLPTGWLGKNWACQQLARAATGELLVFTDADVRWRPEALGAVVAQLARSRCDMMTVWPTQETHGWAERLTVPLMALAVLGYLPEVLVRFAPWSVFAAANGQCLVFQRTAYLKVGGHAAVRGQIVEDVGLARRAKRHRLRLLMADGNGLITCRMYTGWKAVRDGFAKNIIAGYGGIIPLAIATIFHWSVFFAPWVWLVVQPALWPFVLVALGVGVRLMTAAATRQRPGDALLMPLSVLLMTVIAGQAVWWRVRYGGPRWKGRTITSVGQ
ncbi:MAG: glycosyltransferase [Aggregatilineaceae bacterium]